MAREQNVKAIDVTHVPELRRLVKEVCSTNEPRILRQENKDVAIVRPLKPLKRSIPRGRPTSAKDPLWALVGIGASEGPGDISSNKHKYLADAYSDLHE